MTTKVSTPEYEGVSGGSDTQDKIWLLSRDEVKTYFYNTEAMKAAPTKYAVTRGAHRYSGSYTLNGTGYCRWWLRSPCSSSRGASIVLYDGSLR